MTSRHHTGNVSRIDTYMYYLHCIDDAVTQGKKGYVIANDFRTGSGSRPQAAVMKELFNGGFLKKLGGRPFAYTLTRPLWSVTLADLTVLAGPQKRGYSLITLLDYGGDLSLSVLKTTPVPAGVFRGREEPYSFDFIIALARTFDHERYLGIDAIRARLGGDAYTYTYIIGAIGALYRCGLVTRKTHTGYLANKPFKQMTLKDITPAVTRRSPLLNTLLHLFRHCPLSRFI